MQRRADRAREKYTAMATQTQTTQTTTKAEAAAQALGRKLAIVPEYQASQDAIRRQQAGQQAEAKILARQQAEAEAQAKAAAKAAQAEAEASQATPEAPEATPEAPKAPAAPTTKGASRAARKAEAEAKARAAATPATPAKAEAPASAPAGIKGAATVPAGKLRYTRKGADETAATQTAKGAKGATPASGTAAKAPKGAKTQAKAEAPAKAPKAPKAPAPVYTDAATPVLSPITPADVYQQMGAKQYQTDLHMATREGKATRWGGCPDLILWHCGYVTHAHKETHTASEHLYLAARALARAIENGDLTPQAFVCLTDKRPTKILYIFAELTARHLFTAAAVAAYVNGWHLLAGGTRQGETRKVDGLAVTRGEGAFYRRVYHLPAVEQTAFATWLANMDSPRAPWAPATPATIKATPVTAPEASQTGASAAAKAEAN